MRGPIRWVLMPFVASIARARFLNPSDVPIARDAPEGRAPGPDPQRIFLTGGGISVGWGVVTHQLALIGALARALSARTRRGTHVVGRVGLTVGPIATIKGLKQADLSNYDAVVVTLGTYRAFRLGSLRRWRRDFGRVVAQVKSSAPHAVAVFTGMPPLRSTNASNDLVDAIVNVHARHMNQITEEVCSEASVEFLPITSRPTNQLAADWNARVYSLIGSSIADRLADRLA